MKRAVPIRNYLLFDLNPLIRLLIISDTIFISAVGLLQPIFSLFIVEDIDGGNAAVAGIAAAVFLVTKSVLQVPIASFIDKIRGEKDDFAIMFVGTILAAIMPLSYLFITTPGQLYVTQLIYGFLVALTFPSFMAIFTRHADRQREGTTWGVYYMFTDLGAAVTASIGGFIAQTIGFPAVIISVSFVSLVGALLLYPVRKYVRMPRRRRR